MPHHQIKDLLRLRAIRRDRVVREAQRQPRQRHIRTCLADVRTDRLPFRTMRLSSRFSDSCEYAARNAVTNAFPCGDAISASSASNLACAAAWAPVSVAAAAVVLLAVLEQRTRWAGRWWARIAGAALASSFTGPLQADSLVAGVTLTRLHLLVGLALII